MDASVVPAGSRPRAAEWLAILSIVALAATARFWGIGFGLPYLYHPDEPGKIEIAQQMLKTGDLNPHYFRKPTLLIYANALLYVPYYYINKANGRFATPQDIPPVQRTNMGVGYIGAPDAVLMGRALTAVIGTAGVLVLWLLARWITGSSVVALTAALLLAISPINVIQGHYIETNAFLVLALLAVLWASVRLLERGTRADYILAGFLTGVAMTCKYPGVVGFVMPLAAHWLRSGRRWARDHNLLASALAVPAGFLLFTPFALLDPISFVLGAGSEAAHYAIGHEGAEGWAPFWYIGYAFRIEGLVTLAAVLGGWLAWKRKEQRMLVVTAFALGYYLFISLFRVRNDRTFMPITPFLFLLGAWALMELWRLAQQWTQGRRVAARCAIVAGLVAGIAVPGRAAYAATKKLTITDSRETGRVWIEQHLPPGSHVAIESYAPWVAPDRYVLEPVRRIIDHPPEWYVEQKVDYVVVSRVMYGRFYRDRKRYAADVAQYEALFNRFELLQEFHDGGLEVKVYAVR
ncbi:MAG TPA: glycosyltransferase family 39 protein [Gemmatimonadales bacterium]|nr:glycosyltransferase family 39 protein [Gemmatimonadales bacterium]